MCGINGLLLFAEGDLHAQKLVMETITSMMKRRGPDDDGLWDDQKYCIMGFRRLSILDLSKTGHQPMTTPDGRYVLVYNGEIYNFREIRNDLEKKGIQFRSSGDTEVVLHALALFGKRALESFNGMFALAFYDQQEHKLLLARDYAGMKPLYYLLNDQGLTFASQYDQIMAHPWANCLDASQDALALYLRLGHIPAPYAALEKTHMLEPGTWLEINRDKQINQGRFFEFPCFQEPDLFGEKAYEAVDATLTQSVRRHLVSDVPIGSFLSGGIDSPLIAAKIKELGREDIQAFTLGVHDHRLDESQDAAAYAKEIGIVQNVEFATPDQALDLLQDVVSSCGEPFADFSIFPTLQISRLASRHVKVMLSGDGGDELFWGYATRFGSILQKCSDFKMPYWLRSAQWGMKRFLGLGKGHYNLRQHSIGEWYLKKHSKISESLLSKIFPELPALPTSFQKFEYAGSKLTETAQWLRWNEYQVHLPMVLSKVDRASMYHSLEVRMPFLDREMIRVAIRTDWKSCLNTEKKMGKLPLRRSLAKYVQHQTINKRGFAVPMGDWLRKEMRPLVEAELLNRRELLGMPLSSKALHGIFREHLSNNIDHTSGLWLLLSLALWEKRYRRQPAQSHRNELML